jgi:hypothetical protein
LRYLERENQVYPDLHQVVSNVILTEINKNVFFAGAAGAISPVFLIFLLTSCYDL